MPRKVIVGLLLCYIVMVATIGLWPTHVDTAYSDEISAGLEWLRRHGVALRYGQIEATANLILFVPLGLLIALLVRRQRWWLGGLLGTMVSAGIELMHS